MTVRLNQKKSFLYIVRFSWVSIILLIVFLFLFFKIVPFGKALYSKDYATWLKSGKGFIYNFTPADRIMEKKGDLPQIIGDPVYFSVFTPRTFSEAEVTVKYIDHLSEKQSIVEAGVLADNIIWRYELRPLQNKFLDNLALIWNSVEKEDITLFQFDKNYASVDDFLSDVERGTLKNCPGGPTSCLAVYNFSPVFNLRLNGLRESLPTTIDLPLRGAHVMYVYINEEPLMIDLDLIDLNQSKNEDNVQIILSQNGRIIKQAELLDFNNKGISGQEEAKRLSLEQRDLPPGAYKLDIKITDDMVIKKINCSLSRFVFANKLWPVSAGRDIKIFTNASYLQAKAVGPASVQKINFGGQEFDLSEPYQQFEFISQNESGIKSVSFAKDDVILENNGVFSLSRDVIFNPFLPKVDTHFIPNQNIKYILASYKTPAEIDGYTIASAKFNLIGAYREKGKYNFMLSIPGLKTDGTNSSSLEVKEISIRFSGRTIWQKIFNLGK